MPKSCGPFRQAGELQEVNNQAQGRGTDAATVKKPGLLGPKKHNPRKGGGINRPTVGRA